MNKPISRVLPLCALAALVVGCQREPEPRHYREIVTRGENSTLQGNPRAAMTWTLPEGWTVQPEGDPMRLTGFWAPDPARVAAGETDPKPVDVSIVQLAGDAGGLTANVTRWLGQIKVQGSLAQQAISEATPVRLASGQQGIVVDFTNLLSGDMTQTESIVGAIVTVGEYTVFVKAMGGRERLQRLKPVLIAFCESLSVGAAGDADTARETP
jgi:hypothetical protein